jgi:Domain of unknown function (DUF4397)
MKFHAGVLRTARSVAALAVIAAAAGGTLAAGAIPASASVGFGWLRLAHLSPNTPAVDVYLYSVGQPTAIVVLKHVAYGDESPYERVTAGGYTVAMRAAGAAPGSKPVLSTLVDVAAGHAYTVAGMGPFKALRLQVLSDLLSTPPGKALVRIIQASLQEKRVTVALGTQTVASGLEFGTATSYVAVTPGAMAARATAGAATATSQVSFAAGSIHTLVVLDDPGHLTLQVLEDAAGSSAIPAGAAGTGFGGTAAQPGPAVAPWLAAGLFGLMLAGGGAVRLRSRRAGAHARAQ